MNEKLFAFRIKQRFKVHANERTFNKILNSDGRKVTLPSISHV